LATSGTQETPRLCDNEKPFRIARNGIYQPGSNCVAWAEDFAAATALAGIGVSDFEPARSEAITEVDDGTAEVLGAERVNENSDAVHLAGEIVRALFIKSHGYCMPEHALIHIDTERFCLRSPVLEQDFDFLGGAGVKVTTASVGGRVGSILSEGKSPASVVSTWAGCCRRVLAASAWKW
jgi:hypothetical protein